MKLYKLSQGSTFENLKHFIYLTNEYGVPSDEFIDAFIEQFGKIILNGNFTITQNQCKQLDELWEAIVKDCIHNNVEYKENYSSLFYIVLNTKALAKIKEDWEQSEWNQLDEQDKLDLLRTFIHQFDKHIQEGIDMQELYFENTPNLIRTDADGKEYIEIHNNTKNKIANAHLYKDKVVLLKGSYIFDIKQSVHRFMSTEKRLENLHNKYVVNNTLIQNIEFKSPSGASDLYYGTCTNGWTDWLNNNEQPINIYRFKQNITTNTTQVANVPKYNYKITNPMYIGHELTIKECIDDKSSTYKATVIDNVNIKLTDNNCVININKLLEETEGRKAQLTITMGFFKFEDIYTEDN